MAGVETMSAAMPAGLTTTTTITETAEEMLENLEFDLLASPTKLGRSASDSEIDINELFQDSCVFHQHGKQRKSSYKSLFDSDTLSTTVANSSLTSSFRSENGAEHRRTSPPRKCVRFNLNDDDSDDENYACCHEPFAEEYGDENPPLTLDEKMAVWWQPNEFKLFRRYCKRSADIARTSDYADKFTEVYDACSQNHIDDLTKFTHVSRVSVRGLEAVVFPALVHARRLVVHGVVQTQNRLDPNLDVDERAKILSATSRCLSGRSRAMARVFGVGDEEVAKDCYYSMDCAELEASSTHLSATTTSSF